MTLHLAAASALGRGGTAVSEEGEAGRQKRRERQRRCAEEERREENARRRDRRLDGGKGEGNGERSLLAAMGSESEVDKERNMGNHRRGKRQTRAGTRERGGEGCVGKGR